MYPETLIRISATGTHDGNGSVLTLYPGVHSAERKLISGQPMMNWERSSPLGPNSLRSSRWRGQPKTHLRIFLMLHVEQARGIEATWSFSRLTPLYWAAPIVGALQRSYPSVEAPNLMNVIYHLLCIQFSAPCEVVPDISIALMDPLQV